MDMALKILANNLNMKDISIKEKNTEKELIFGLMNPIIRVVGKRTNSMAMESTAGLMVNSSKVNGETIKRMATVYKHGKMGGGS